MGSKSSNLIGSYLYSFVFRTSLFGLIVDTRKLNPFIVIYIGKKFKWGFLFKTGKYLTSYVYVRRIEILSDCLYFFGRGLLSALLEECTNLMIFSQHKI